MCHLLQSSTNFFSANVIQLHIQEYVNIEEDEDFSQWESHQALPLLQRDIGDLDPTKVKLVSTISSAFPHEFDLLVSSLTSPFFMPSSFLPHSPELIEGLGDRSVIYIYIYTTAYTASTSYMTAMMYLILVQTTTQSTIKALVTELFEG